ncbi:MAG TPA: helix-turn-helix domain-containing protein, partial [Candidatus Manganitrophaceae bacterium]|nr:helix-turn-helix domain-containing protein [Candidatus Manganitrophaceae bacterium]
EGRFREDLLYRFRVVTITLPPLRERREDIPLLADYFLKQHAAGIRKEGLSFSAQAIELMSRYDWPGNVRELQHAIEQAVVLTAGRVIVPEDLPLSIRSDAAGDALPPFPLMTLGELQRRYLIRLLREIPNRTELAKILGIDRRTLYRMARRYGLPLSEEKGEGNLSSE